MLAARSNFNPKVCIIDNVPPSWEQENLSNIETKLNIRPPTSDEKWTSCSWRYGLCGSWQPVTNAVISDWKLDGSYHELFSTSPNVVVPEHMLEVRDLKDEVEAYKTALIDEVFEPAALGADRHDRRPKLSGSKKLAEDVISTERYIDMYI